MSVDSAGLAARLGIKPGMVVQELGWDEDADEDLEPGAGAHRRDADAEPGQPERASQRERCDELAGARDDEQRGRGQERPGERFHARRLTQRT